MDSLSASIINTAVGLSQAQAQQAIQTQVLKTALNMQAAAAAALVQALPTPGLASSGSVGTLLNVYA
ncbi:putative motility protein [Pseudomarimonas arenosa]|uniref:Motility protein n=1 Tax=Pseudomarimonas arenosa TaxID=2774145 RepID=A0AAW3ZQG0_9GAMM|nr:putative motility protein [Pseudomarimonas arenosa]MBD8526837.1 putative motility protein [Pseudomarimonas arenosa]